MNQSTSIKETKEALNFAFDVFGAIQASSEDGKITVADVPHFLQVAMKAPEAVKGINFVPGELMQLDASGNEEIKQLVAERFNISNDAAEPYYEQILIHFIGLYRAGARLYHLKNKAHDA